MESFIPVCYWKLLLWLLWLFQQFCWILSERETKYRGWKCSSCFQCCRLWLQLAGETFSHWSQCRSKDINLYTVAICLSTVLPGRLDSSWGWTNDCPALQLDTKSVVLSRCYLWNWKMGSPQPCLKSCVYCHVCPSTPRYGHHLPGTTGLAGTVLWAAFRASCFVQQVRCRHGHQLPACIQCLLSSPSVHK